MAFKNIQFALHKAYLPFYVVILIVVDRITNKNFDNQVKLYPIFLFVTVFLYNVAFNGISDYFNDKDFDNIEFISNDKTSINQIKDYSTIGATANYFIFKNDSSRIKVIKKDRFDMFQVKK